MSNIAGASAFVSFRQFDSQSLELANGWIYVYKSGTSTLVQLYSNVLGTPRSNPAQLDGSGKLGFFGEQQACKVVITDVDGVQIDEADPVWLFGQSGGGNGSGSMAIVANYAELRALTEDFDVVLVLGRLAAGDGGFGIFEHISTSSAGDNDGTVLIRQSTSRYVRQYAGYIDPRWFGLVYGGTVDQMTNLDKALAVGPTRIQGSVYLNQDHHLTGTMSILSGGFVTGAAPKLYLDGKLESACAGAFGAGIKVVLGKSVATSIRTSWFSSLAQSLCSTYSYPYLVDADASISAALTIPYNYAVDFPNGSVITVTAAANVDIANLVYQGSTQIIKYASLAYVGSVRVGTGACLLEWFGGLSGSNPAIDNTIPAAAAMAHGSIKLIAPYYHVGSVGGTRAYTHKLEITGDDTTNYRVLDLAQSITVTDLLLTYVHLSGAATVTSSGQARINKTEVKATALQPTGTTDDLNAGAYLSASYFAAGANGMLRNSSDLTTWTARSAGSNALRSIAKGPVWIAVSDAGSAYRSVDGGTNWTAITIGSATWYKVKYLRGQYVVVGTSGAVYVSVDGISWNNRSIAGSTSTLRDFDYSVANSLWIVVGTAASVYSSADLISYSVRALPSGITGDLLAVACYAGADATTTTIISGALGGAYLLASDSLSYLALQLGTSETIYSIATSSTAIVMTSGLGNVYVSNSTGQQFAKTSLGSNALLCVTQSNNQWLIGGSAGNVWSSVDLKAWAHGYVGVAVDVLSVYIGDPVYACIGDAGVVLTSISGNGLDWKLAAVPGVSSDWFGLRVINGLAWLCGAGGRLYASSDMVSFVSIATATANDLHDITYDATSSRYVVCGSNGLVQHCSASTILTPAPAWTIVTTGTTATLRKAARTTSMYVFGGFDTVVASTDLTNSGTKTLSVGVRGMVTVPISGGTLYVMYGDSGLILTSTDRYTWTVQTSGTTSNLLCGITQNNYVLLAGVGGVMLRALNTNPATWTNIGVGTSSTIRAISYHPTRFELGICGDAGIAYKSSNNGTSWVAMPTGSGNDMLDIWPNGTSWESCGLLGSWYTTADGVTWTMRETSVRAGSSFPTHLRCGFGNTAYGDDGWMGYADAKPTIHSAQNRFGLRGINFVRIVNNTLLSSDGRTWSVAYGPDHVGSNSITCVGYSGLTDPGVGNLWLDAPNNALYAVGSTTYKSLSSSNYLYWVKAYSAYAGVNDMVASGAGVKIVGDNGLVAQSNNGYLWVSLAEPGDTTTRQSVAYYEATGLTGEHPEAPVYVSAGGKSVLAGAGGWIQAGSGVATPLLVLTYSEITDSEITTQITSTYPAVVRNSRLGYLDNAGPISDSVISVGIATASADILRSDLTLVAPVNLTADLLISESSITKTAAWDRSGVLFGEITASVVRIDNSDLEWSGMLAYSVNEDLEIRLNNCRNSSGFAQTLTNGYARVYLTGCNPERNSSAYAIDDDVLATDVVSLGAEQVLTASTTDWSGLPAATTDGTSLTLTAAAWLGPEPTCPQSFRWHGSSNTLALLQNAGGRIEVEVEYPTGYTPDQVGSVKVALVRPSFVWARSTSGQGQTVVGPINDELVLGVQAPAAAIAEAGKLRTVANVWSGFGAVMCPFELLNPVHHVLDPWGDLDFYPQITPTIQANNPNSARVVIWSTGVTYLPVGTKLTVKLIPVLPTTKASYRRWFADPDRSLDTYQQIERQQLAFVAADSDAGVDLAYAPVAATSTPSDIKWLSLAYVVSAYVADKVYTTPVQYIYPFGNDAAVDNFSGLIVTDKSKSYLGLASSGLRVTLHLVNLADSTWVAGYILAPNGSQQLKLDRYVIAYASWSTVTITRVTLP